MKTTAAQRRNDDKLRAQHRQNMIDDPDKGYVYCQRCERNESSAGKMQLAHPDNKGMGGTTHIYTLEETELICNKCHSNEDHGGRVK